MIQRRIHTGYKPRLAAIALLSASMVLASVGVAHAQDGQSDADEVAAEVAAVAPSLEVTTPQFDSAPTPDSNADAILPVSAEGSVELPSSGGLEAVTIGLPATSAHGDAVVAEDGTAVYKSDSALATDIAVQSFDGGVRIQTIIRDSSADTEYSFQLSSNVAPEINEDGSVFLGRSDAEGQTIAAGFISAPWAADANGASVATHFEIRGSALVQVVEHDRAGVAYPVVADPSVSYCTLGGWYPAQCFKWTRAETRAAGSLVAGGAGAAVVAADMCKAAGGAVGTTCKAAIAVVFTAASGTILSASNTAGKCLAFTFSFPAVAQFLAGGMRSENC